MSNLELKGNWNELKGKLKQKFANLTDNDVLLVEGKQDEMLGNLQYKLKGASAGFLIASYRLLFGAFLGLTFALIGERVVEYGGLSFTFVMVVTCLVFFRLSRPWKLSTIMIFSLISILVGLLLRLYIQVAPGY